VPTFKLTLAYDGTDFVGWQRQASGVSVQGLLEEALSELDGRAVPVMGAGRTDAGVHASGQVAGISLTREIESDALIRALNTRLPQAVRVVAAAKVPASFHARFQARSKTYEYRIWNADVMSPFERAYTWHVPFPSLNVDAMTAAASRLEGRHDFAAFQAAGADAHDTNRIVFASTLRVLPVSLANGGTGLADSATGFADGALPAPENTAAAALITYRITGSGFLRYMVRTIIGTLVEIGRGRRSSDWIAEVLESRERARAGPTAPAEGLFLVRVDYE
jgi:tRNA pseudouridine38-40 synthase